VKGLGQQATAPGDRSREFLLIHTAALGPRDVVNIVFVIALGLIGTGCQISGLTGMKVHQSKRRNLFLWHRKHQKGIALHETGARQNCEYEKKTR
jgi:hypothetical protein